MMLKTIVVTEYIGWERKKKIGLYVNKIAYFYFTNGKVNKT